MKKIEISQLSENFIETIGKEWMLVTAGSPDAFNTMTASWGGIGFLWNKPVVFVFVRPERYTFEFMEKNDDFTLSFLGAENRKIYTVCGSSSGRDTDKVRETGLIPVGTERGNVVFGQSRLNIECRKMYADTLRTDRFIDHEALTQWYEAKGGMHQMFVAEIVNVWTNE